MPHHHPSFSKIISKKAVPGTTTPAYPPCRAACYSGRQAAALHPDFYTELEAPHWVKEEGLCSSAEGTELFGTELRESSSFRNCQIDGDWGSRVFRMLATGKSDYRDSQGQGQPRKQPTGNLGRQEGCEYGPSYLCPKQ